MGDRYSKEHINARIGIKKLEWARTHMKILNFAKKQLSRRFFDGIRIAMALHVEAKTGVLALTFKELGADVRLASCNPLSTDDSVAEALNELGVKTYAKKGDILKKYYSNLNNVLDIKPHIIIDDGCDLAFLVHKERQNLLENIIGGNEETTTGVMRLKSLEEAKKLQYPVIAVNNAQMKYLFDNRYGTGQSTIDGILTATNMLIAGKTAVVAGYGWCGKGIAMRLRGLGADVIVTEISPIRAIEAKLDGYRVMPMQEAVKHAHLIVTATGNKDIISLKNLKIIRDGAILCNSGHFDVEIRKDIIEEYAIRKRIVRNYVTEYKLKNGKTIYVLADGRLVNLAIGQGHPIEIMDLSFSLQLLCAAYLLGDSGTNPTFLKKLTKLENKVYSVPEEIDNYVAKLALKTMNLKIDELTKAQIKYLKSYNLGT